MNEPALVSSEFVFTQEGNTMGTTSDQEQISIILQTQIPGEHPFVVIETEGWSFDGNELADLIQKCLNTMMLKEEKENE